MSLQNPWNAYTCEHCKETIVTQDMADGVTPFMIGCQKCGLGFMRSHFYNVPEYARDMVVGYWKKEMPSNYSKEDREISKDHQDNGGLFLHYIEEKPNAHVQIPTAHYSDIRKYQKLRPRKQTPTPQESTPIPEDKQ